MTRVTNLIFFFLSICCKIICNYYLDPSDLIDSENLLKNVDCHLKLITFLTFVLNFREKHRSQPFSFTAEDMTQVYKLLIITLEYNEYLIFNYVLCLIKGVV